MSDLKPIQLALDKARDEAIADARRYGFYRYRVTSNDPLPGTTARPYLERVDEQADIPRRIEACPKGQPIPGASVQYAVSTGLAPVIVLVGFVDGDQAMPYVLGSLQGVPVAVDLDVGAGVYRVAKSGLSTLPVALAAPIASHEVLVYIAMQALSQIFVGPPPLATLTPAGDPLVLAAALTAFKAAVSAIGDSTANLPFPYPTGILSNALEAS